MVQRDRQQNTPILKEIFSFPETINEYAARIVAGFIAIIALAYLYSHNIYLLALMKNRKMLSSGWIFFGKKWKVTEIDVSVALNKTYLLFDFETPENLRNKGYYTLLLKLIKNKFRKKRLAIYTLSYNFKSRRGIENAGFKFVRKIYN